MVKLVNRTEFAKIAGVSGAAVTKATKSALKNAVDGMYIDADHEDALAYIKKIERDKTPETLPGIDPLYAEAVKICGESGKWTIANIKSSLQVGSTRAGRIHQQIKSSGAKESYEREQKIFASKPHVRGTAARKAQQMERDTSELEPMIPENIAKYAHMPLIEIIEKFGTAPRFKDWLSALKEISAIEERNIKIAQQKGKLVSRELVKTQIVEQIDSAHIKLLRDGSRTITTRVCAMYGAQSDPVEIERTVADLISSFIKPVKVKVSRAMRAPVEVESDDD